MALISNVFICACNLDKEFKHTEIIKHLQTAHQLQNPINGNKQMVMHMDTSETYSSTYKWTFPNEIIVHQYITNSRDMDDPMRY